MATTAPGGLARAVRLIDVVPTILEVAGIRAPEAVDGIKQAPIEGTSFQRTRSGPHGDYRFQGGLARAVRLIDVVPTILEVAGIRAPEAVDGIKQAPIEGTSFAYTFDAKISTMPRRNARSFSLRRRIVSWSSRSRSTNAMTKAKSIHVSQRSCTKVTDWPP